MGFDSHLGMTRAFDEFVTAERGRVGTSPSESGWKGDSPRLRRGDSPT